MASKQTAVKVGVGAAGAAAGAKTLAAAGVLKSGFLFKTVATLFISLALYARMYGWGFAGMVILLLLIHEMGHWVWMKMRGLNPDAPVFVPFMGAYVAMTKMPADEATHAWVAFAGPLVGGMGALVIYVIGACSSNGTLMAGGSFGFFLNLLQLIPAKPLDGGFIASAVSKWLLIPGMILVLVLGFVSGSILLLIIGGISAFSLFKKKQPARAASASAAAAAAAPGNGGESAQPEIVSSPNAEAAEQNMKPATGRQRFFIGLAYVSLALFLGVAQMVSQVQMLSNREYAGGQIQVLSDQIARDDDADLYRDRSQCYATVGKIREAEADMQHVVTAGSEDVDDYLALARYRFAQGHLDGTASDALGKAMNLAAERSMDSWIVAYGYVLANDYSNAMKAAEHCDDGDKSDIEAVVFSQTDKLKDAHASYDLAIKNMVTSPLNTYCRKAIMEMSEGELPLAKVDVEEAEAISADDPLSIATRGWYDVYSGNAKSAASKADEAVHKFQDDNFDRMDKWHIMASCARLKAVAYTKLSEQATNTAAKQKDAEVAAREMNTYKDMPGFGIFVPKNVDSI